MSLHFQLKLNIGGSLSFSSGRSLNSAHRWAVTRKPSVCGHALVYSFLCGDFHPEICLRIFDIRLLNYVSANHGRKKSHCHLYQTSHNVHCFAIVMLNATGIMINTVTSGSNCRSKNSFYILRCLYR
jgi:hypothetical protein